MPALIFDCDGVLADTERAGHLPAFNRTFAELGVPVQWSDDEYRELVRIGGGKERMRSLLTAEFVAANGYPTDDNGQAALLKEWHARKTAAYTALVDAGELPARPGIARLVAEANDAGWQLAVASTSAEPSVRAVLTHAVGDRLAQHFTVLAGDIVPRKKPAPDIYLLALERLGTTADDAIVVEDSGGGLAAALAAGLRTVVTVSAYTADDDFTGAALVVPDLDHGPGPDGNGGPVTVATLASLLKEDA
ncbi:HAD-IA family hydrolase [Xylanimonas sp. McL0601]|uniref:HAD-IA family hydrolase n=1 Tax=Xylanimonas sp. McL0601 TaxID=3414739 RepID=UPI003CED553A